MSYHHAGLAYSAVSHCHTFDVLELGHRGSQLQLERGESRKNHPVTELTILDSSTEKGEVSNQHPPFVPS